MGNVSSRPDEAAALYLRDQTRLTISSLSVTNARRRTILNVVPNAFPATKVSATRDPGDNSLVEFIQDPETSSAPSPNFILKLNNEDELIFKFTFVVRQTQQVTAANNNGAQDAGSLLDTTINGLTYVSASTPKEVETLVTREFHADPNLHKNANVQLVGDYGTGGNQSVSFEWSWKWRPPKAAEDRGGGWRNNCSFVEYDQRAHRLNTLASFSFWIQNTQMSTSQPNSPSPPFNLIPPPKLRLPSSQSMDSRISGTEVREYDELPSPSMAPNDTAAGNSAIPKKDLVKVDVSCHRPGEDMSATEDGPLFRATMKALEQKTGNLRQRMKKVLKKAEAAHMAQIDYNDAISGFTDALREASSSNANAVQPALEHYFDKIAREILGYEKQNSINLQRIIIDPIAKLYNFDIKQAEAKKRDFEEGSKDYYSYVSKYLGQRQDSMKQKKKTEQDTKYQAKRRNFELKRFDYSSFMQDLHGGRKEQEVLSQLTKYAAAQTKSYLTTAKKIEEMLPQLDALNAEVQDADKEFQYKRTEREEKRRNLEKSTVTYVEPDAIPTVMIPPQTSHFTNTGSAYISDSELGRSDSTAPQLKQVSTNGTAMSLAVNGSPAEFSRSPGSLTSGIGSVNSPGLTSKFKGFRDLEEKDHSLATSSSSTQRKEGLLWALSRPGSHVDPMGLNKQAWHKFWIVLDAGKVSEYSNWKQRLDLHMEPIDLRMASVREARNAERRFCFEVITPHYKRVYQATSEDDMNNWISAMNNAIQSAVEGRDMRDAPKQPEQHSVRRDIGSILTGKSSSMSHGHSHGHSHGSSQGSAAVNNGVFRRTTVGARPAYNRQGSSSYDESPDKLLQLLREADQGNCWCADCGSGIKTEWVSINLAIILCIECSGIHRSLGTHISKVRSLTLDITSFTTDIVELLLLVGNRVSNMVWEARLDPSSKPSPQATREERLRFITAKYVERAFVEPISSTLSRFATADEILLAAIKKNDIQQVIYALALKANPNVLDKSRGTHSVFLALAAADPASPSSAASPSRPETSTKVVAFPIAEMLVQNSAEIPAALPAFPLSRSAALYIEQKSGRGAPASDTLSSLPVVNSTERAQRDKEARLQKRVSAGGRLAKVPIPER